MKKRINTGKINENHEYEKHVSFSKAVLWKDRQLSLRPTIIIQLGIMEVKTLVFIDEKKAEKWIFTLEDIIKHGQKRRIGQEEQIYFPISLAKVITL